MTAHILVSLLLMAGLSGNKIASDEISASGKAVGRAEFHRQHPSNRGAAAKQGVD
jgi:hypothetical protein